MTPLRIHPQLRFAAFAAVAYYLPAALLFFGVIPFAYRFVVLVVMAGLLGGHAALRGLTPRELGLTREHLHGSLVANGTLSAILALLLIGAFSAHAIRTPTIPAWRWFFPFYVLISSPAQEFLYRSVMFAELRRAGIDGVVGQVLLSALTYCLLHSIYRDWITLAVTLFMGIVWGLLYRRWPNLWGVALSHAVLGALSILTGLV